MKTTLSLTAIVLLVVCTTAGAYEFELRTASSESDWAFYGGGAYSADRHEPARPTEHKVATTVKPEECRFYLTYNDDGRDAADLLQGAKAVAGHLEKALAGVEQAKVEILPVDYSPERSWRGIFVGEKAEISVSFRVTIKLALEGEDRFWQNADLVARVLGKIAEAKKDADWGRNLSEGRVAYAVESLEPTKAVLYGKAEEEVKALRESLFAANGAFTGKSDILYKIYYGNPSTSRVTLEEVEVVLPYSVEIALKDQTD